MENKAVLPSRAKLMVVILMLILAICAGSLTFLLRDEHATSSGTALIGGPFTMLNQRGETVTDKTYIGKYMLLFFGFTNCNDVCPTELQVMTAALEQMGPDADKITPLFVSIDPERDTTDVIKTYVSAFHPSLQGLTGSLAQVAAFAKTYHIFYKKVPNPQDPKAYEMDHSSILYLMGPDGKFLKYFNYSTDAKLLAEDLQKVLHT
jgi:cytochrome oxidase Cu insertion factor (SCO1/SenC/PrrC family)